MDSPRFTVPSELLLEHAAWVRQLAFELVREPGAADDLAQETWLAFLRARPDTRRPLRPWLARVARNAARLGARRRAGRRAQEAEAARPERLPSAHDLVERAEEQQRLARAVLELDEPYRTTLLLRYYEGLGPSEIARARRLPAVTVRSHIHRGLERLRRRLDDEHGGDRKAWVAMLEPLLGRSGTGAAAGPALAALLVAGLGLSMLVGPWIGAQKLGEAPPAAIEATATERAVASDRLASAPAAFVREPARSPELAPTERALHLMDASGRPLGDYAVRAGGLTWRSDAAGRLLLPAELTELVPIDDERLAIDERVGHARRSVRPLRRDPVRFAATGDELRLTLPAGPSFRLELSTPGRIDVADMQARLASSAPSEAIRADAAVQLAPLRPAAEAADQAWVRFGAPALAPAQLELRDGEGLWSGTAFLAEIPAGAPQRVRVELARTCVLEGRVDGVPAGRHAAVEMFLMRADDTLASSTAPDERGRYALRWVDPGEYVLHVLSSLHSPWSGPVELLPGERVVRDLELVPAPSAGPIAGVVTSASNRHDGQLLVFLLDAQGATIDVFPTTWRVDESERRIAPFRFEDAPHGALRLDVLSLADAVLFRASPESFEAPFERLRVALEDERPASDWSVEVLDAASGLALEAFELEVRVEGGPPRRFRREAVEGPGAASKPALPQWTLFAGGLRWNRFESAAALRRLPDDARFEWTLHAEGYRPACGDATAFAPGPPGQRRATVRLRPSAP